MIRVGVAGWDYADWIGPVYPTATGRRLDKLAFLARFVDVIEINSSFYRPVAPRVAESWAARTRDVAGFRFTAKSHRSWTHERAPDLDRSVDETLAGLAPLREDDRLGALLVQFPQSFHCTPQALRHLDRIAERVSGWPAVIEVRHISWSSDAAEEWFERRRIGWCAVDQPRVGGSTVGIVPRVTSPVGYLRLHGRNAGNWFRPDAGRDARYDYRYSTEELGRVAASVRTMADAAAEMYVVQNNHFRGQALVNALQLRQMLSGEPPKAPQQLVDAYPDLAESVTVERTRLF